MVEEKDKSQRLLFSHPELVEDLIRHFVGGKWIKLLDFSTLEKVSERDISKELIRREKDLIWRLRYRGKGGKKGGWFYVYLHIEFQSEPQQFTALRMLTYKALFYEDLIRNKSNLTEDGLLPPVLSVVVYNGKRDWNEARSLEELIAPIPEFVGSPLPDGLGLSSYHLIAGKNYPADLLEEFRSPVAALFQLEQSKNREDVSRGIKRLHEILLATTDNPSLVEACVTWLITVLLPAIAPGFKIGELRDLTEVDSMLHETVIEWRDGWLEEGRQEGRKEGRALLLRQLESKFGPLPQEALARVKAAKGQQLLQWGERLLTVSSLDKVFKP